MNAKKLTAKGEPRLWVDQHGQTEIAATVKELRRKCGGGRVSKMYVDLIDGRIAHVGYVVGQRWFRCFVGLRVIEEKHPTTQQLHITHTQGMPQ